MAEREEMTKSDNKKNFKKEGKTKKLVTVNFFVYRIKMVTPLSI